MTYFIVLWLAYACPGGILSGIWPEVAKPLICAPELKVERFSDRKQAESKIKDLGPMASSRIQWCKGLKCYDIKIQWESVVKIGN
jgi:hypothetical protein